VVKSGNKLFSKIKEPWNRLSRKKWFGIALDDFFTKLILAVILIVTILTLLPSERPFEYSNLTVGSVSNEEIIAPFTFPIIKSEAVLERERREAWLSVPPVFEKVPNVETVQKIKLQNLFSELSDYFKSIAAAGDTKKDSVYTTTMAAKRDSVLKQISVKYNLNIALEDLQKLYDYYTNHRLQKYLKILFIGFHQIYQKGVLNLAKEKIGEKEISLLTNGMEEKTKLSEVYDPDEARKKLREIVSGEGKKEFSDERLNSLFISTFLLPDFIYNQQISKERKEKAVHEVPTTSGFVHKSQRIVDSHEVITPGIYQKLQSLSQALQERSALQRGWKRALFYLGKFIFALLVTIMLGLFFAFHRPKLFANNKMLLMVVLIFLIQFFLTALMVNVLGWNYYSVPIILAPMLLSMLLDAPVAFWGTIMMALVLGASQGNNFYLTLMIIIVGTIALFSVQKIRNRGQMFRAMLYILLGYAVVTFSYGFMHYEPILKILQNFAFYQLPNAILTPTAVFLLIGLFERIFDVTTDITLLELSDLNNPLLKRLSVEAPGTFHHSIIVGNLAEAAAKAIGADTLLTRVGCYYHDIGKMLKPEYFVENQAGAENKHENLTPTMSCLILVKHVKAGLQLAEEYKLPRAVKQFIPEHHGTSLMEYFYHKAQETMDPKDINEDDFRYPGPKPQSRETAIAMLADSVEAAVRSLPNPNMQRITTLVEHLVEKKFEAGQLDECDLTLRGLNKIKEAFKPILMGIYHLRIEYPGEGQGEKAKETAGARGDKPEGKKEETHIKNGEKAPVNEMKPVTNHQKNRNK